MVTAGLIASRFIHFSAVLLLFGVAAFPLYAYCEQERAAQGEALSRELGRTLFFCAIAALISGILWLSFTSASMSGSMAGAADPTIVMMVIASTDFGRIWIWRLALAALLVLLFAGKGRNELLGFAQVAGAALLLTSIAGTGHGGASPGDAGTFHVAADSLHLLAAAVWFGGLLALAVELAGYKPLDLHRRTLLLQRFSAMGTIAVAALVLSGIVNTVFEVDSVGALLTTAYGRWLLVKIALFLVMLALAAANRFWLAPQLQSTPPEEAQAALSRIRQHVALEQAAGFIVLLVVGLLGTLEPAHLQAE